MSVQKQRNWCDMPPEIKAKCIESCGMKERLLLRATARTERALVDSQKTEIPFLRASIGTYQSTISISTGADFTETTDLIFPWNRNRPAPCLELLLKTSRIGVFQLLSTSLISLTRGFIDENAKFSVEVFMHDSACKKDLLYFLNALDSRKIKWIELNGSEEEEMPEIDEIVKIPSVINCAHWQISNYHETDSAVKVAQAWIDQNARIGLTFQVLALEYGTLEDFVIEFEDRIVFHSPNLVRIHTDDPEKHIILKLGYQALEAEHFMGGVIINRLQFLRLLIVSADFENSNLENWIDTVTWMKQLHFHFEFPADVV